MDLDRKAASWAVVLVAVVVALYLTMGLWDSNPKPPGHNFCLANPADVRC